MKKNRIALVLLLLLSSNLIFTINAVVAATSETSNSNSRSSTYRNGGVGGVVNKNKNKNNNNIPNDLDLLISTMDGSIYSFRYGTGMLNWMINQDKSLYSTNQRFAAFEQQKQRDNNNKPTRDEYDDEYQYYDDSNNNDGRDDDTTTTSISEYTQLYIPNIDGSGEFYRYASDGSIQKLPYTLFDIVNNSPVMMPNSPLDKQGKETLYVGSKLTTIIVVDADSGGILKTLTHDGVWEGCSSMDGVCDEADGHTLIFARSDYKVVALDPRSGVERWNLSLGEYKPFYTFGVDDNNNGGGEKCTLELKGSIEVYPMNNRYKLFVKTTDVLTVSSYWDALLPSPPVSIHAYSRQSNVLESVHFTRKLSGADQNHPFAMLPHPEGSTDLVPSGWMPTFIFDNFDGHFYITSNDLRNGSTVPTPNSNTNNDNIIGLITDGNENNSSTNNQNHNNLYNPSSIAKLLMENQHVHTLIVILISGIIIKKLLDYKNKLQKKKPSNNSNPNTPKKKQKQQQQQQKKKQQKQQQLQEEEEEQVEEDELNDQAQQDDQEQSKVVVEPEIVKEKDSLIETRVLLENGNIRIGKIHMTTNVLGTGSCGTVVYEGLLDGRKVAIKRMLKQFIKFADREISLLLHSDEHINVVRYHAKEEDTEFIYLALSYCTRSLDQAVDNKLLIDQSSNNNINNNNHNNNNNNHNTPKKNQQQQQQQVQPKVIINSLMKRMILDLLAGLSHLHSLHIVHRDIKPQNILIDPNNRVKISDMGLGKKLDVGDHSLTFASDSYGWQPAEYLNGSNKSTKKVDIFSMGCVIYYLVTGSNPFGGRFNREKNVLKNKFDIEPISHLPELYHLVSWMIQFDPTKRPTIEECENHPFFWSMHKQMSFLVAASDYLEFEKPSSPLILELDTLIEEVLQGREQEWWGLLDQLLIDNIGRYRKYNGKSVRDLLRVIRNKFNHYRDLPDDVQQCLGALPEGFLDYFKTRFPRLIITTYNFIEKHLKNEAYFKQFYQVCNS